MIVRSVERWRRVPLGMGRVAKTARPEDGVWRIVKSGDVGRVVGVGSVGWVAVLAVGEDILTLLFPYFLREFRVQ